MLSAFKNFLITFLIAALIFGVIGYFATSYLSDIIAKIIDGEEPSSTPVINAPSEETEPDDNGNEGEELKVPDGESFTFVVIGTDYRPDIYTDYYRTEEDFQKIIDEAKKKAEEESKKETSTKDNKDDTNDKDDKNDKDSKKDDKKDSKKKPDPSIVLDTDVRYVRATWIAIVRADKENREYAVCYLSPETEVSSPCGKSDLGEVYGLYGLDTLCQYINALTGLEVDYRFVMDGMNQLDFAKIMGEVTFELKTDLYAGKRWHLSSPTSVVGDEVGEGTGDTEADTEKPDPDESSTEEDTTSATEEKTSEPAETEPQEIVENTPVLEKGSVTFNKYSSHIINTFREDSQDDIDAKGSLILEMLKQYLQRAAVMSVEDLEDKIEKLTGGFGFYGEGTPEDGSANVKVEIYDINDPYSTKPSLATDFSHEDVEYVHSMLEAIEYFDYVEYVYPGAYSEGGESFRPDIKAALTMFEKYRKNLKAPESESPAETAGN